MDISLRDTTCNPHSRLGMDIAGNFSEPFSDSSPNHGDLARIQNNNEFESSPCKEEASATAASKEGDIDRIGNLNGSSDVTSPSAKKALSKQSDALSNTKTNFCLSSSAITDEKDIKKEDASLLSQIISPIAFTSDVCPPPSIRDNEDNNGVCRTMNLSPSSSEKSATFTLSAGNEMEEHSTNTSIDKAGNVTSNIESDYCSANLGKTLSPKCKTETEFASNTSNMSRNSTSFNGNLTKYTLRTGTDSGGLLLNTPGSNSGNDYMQQQNHVFVFSTQLANRSAEAVLCGQFPTIIAYHCMQPTTKLFLEDFLKNPAKTTKLQRQYSLNIMNIMQSGSSGHGGGQPPYWLNDYNNLAQLQSQRLPLRNLGGSSVSKSNSCWDPAAVVENQICIGPSTLDPSNKADAGGKCDDKSNIPSLQGVKVPDENLTPQQRQHREEQLAKLKKMNKFLFPENEGNDLQGPPPHSSSSSISDRVGDSGDVMHNSARLCSDGVANKTCPSTMHNISGNLVKSGLQNRDIISGLAGSDSIMPPDILGSLNDTQNVARVHDHKFGGTISKMNSSTVSNVNAQCDMANDQSAVGLENNSDITSGSNFNMNNCPTSDAEIVGSRPSDMAISPSEWTKFQSSTLQDSFKAERQETPGRQQNSPQSRSLSKSTTSYGSIQSKPNTGTNSMNRNNNGPPPPYHQTQRSASVPIAAESPTNASPKKPSADMPLPLPHASSRVQFGVSATEISNPTIAYNVNSTPQANSHNSILSNMTTNSPVTPRELDCIEPAGQKSKMASPHKFKSGTGSLNDLPDMDAKYSNFGRGYGAYNMPPHNMRHNMQQIPPQFCRRIDNIPLNPNCNRVGQSKNVPNFDPISSLTQMSQQLTGVGLSAIGGGGNTSTGLGIMDINQGELITTGTSIRGSGDPSLDHCNQLSNSNMVGGLAGALGRVTGHFANEMNMLCGDTGHMDQRMLNCKMSASNMPGSFGSNTALTGVGLRESAIGSNDMSSLNRTTNRRAMSGNFDNFSMTPNIHVKVSAPNTIQYMPARSQSMNNMRVPPSVEFFQRYSNGQVMGHTRAVAPMINDIPNPNVINMDGNCTQMPMGVGQLTGSVNRGFEQNNLVDGNALSSNEYMNVPQ